MMTNLLRVVAVCSAAVALVGCGDDTTSAKVPEPVVQAAAVQISAPGQVPGQTVNIAGGASLRLQVAVLDVQGRVMAGVMPELITRNANVATIDSTGLLKTTGEGITHIVGRYVSNGWTVVDSTGVIVTCTDDFRPGLIVTLTDSLTGAPFTGPADFYVRDGAYADSARARLGGVWVAAGERAGTYQLTVRADGYREWTRAAILVPRDACHVTTVSVTARLLRP